MAHLAIYVSQSRGRLRSGVPGRMHHLLKTAHYTKMSGVRSVLTRAVTPWIAAAVGNTSKNPVHSRRAEDLTEESTGGVLLLKAPQGNGEKGVLFAGNESPWPALVRVARQTTLLDHYDLVALSAWSPPKYEKLAHFVGLSSDPVLVGISNQDDLRGYALLAPAILPLPLMASDWLNPDDFLPTPRTERDIDILMVAGWGRYKRHWLLFESLRGLPRTLRVVLIGRSSGGRTVDDVKAEARALRVRQDLTFLPDLPIHQVNEYQGRARVSVIFSGREGACVAVTESFFADTPVGMMEDAHIGSRAHVNAATGVLFSRKGLSRQLGRFVETSDAYRPRAWALENISCHKSSQILNDLLRSRALEAARPWTTDIKPLFRRYFQPRYVSDGDVLAMAPALDDLRQKYGLRLLLPGSTQTS